MTDHEQISEIFLEARSYSLNNEVKELAHKLHEEDPTRNIVEIWQEAFNELIKQKV